MLKKMCVSSANTKYGVRYVEESNQCNSNQNVQNYFDIKQGLTNNFIYKIFISYENVKKYSSSNRYEVSNQSI